MPVCFNTFTGEQVAPLEVDGELRCPVLFELIEDADLPEEEADEPRPTTASRGTRQLSETGEALSPISTTEGAILARQINTELARRANAGILPDFNPVSPDDVVAFFTAGGRPDDLFDFFLESRATTEDIVGATGGGGGGGGAPAGPDFRDLLAEREFQFEQAQAVIDRAERDRDFRRSVFENDRDFEEFKRQFDVEFGEEQRQFDLGFGQRERGQLGDLATQLGRLALDESDFVAEVLRNPADFLARAFIQRGGESPFPEVTQADIINRLRSAFGNVRDLVSGELAASGVGSGAPSVGQPQPRMAAGAGLPTEQEVIDLSATGDAFAGSNESFGALEESLARFGLTFDPTTGQFENQTGGDITLPTRREAATFVPVGDTSFNDPGAVTTVTGFGTEAGTAAAEEEFGEDTLARLREAGLTGFEGGGMTRLPRMLVGDAEPEATELVLNPTQAPIAIIPAPGAEPSRMAPGFQTGTLVPGKREIRSQSQDVRRLPGPEPTTSPSFDQGFNDLLNVLPTAQTTQDELMRLEQLARPPAVDALVTGQTIPDLDVTAGSNFRLFTPQQFAELTPDEVAALSTTLASQNKSLDDFLFSLGRRFESRRERSRGRLNPLR